MKKLLGLLLLVILLMGIVGCAQQEYSKLTISKSGNGTLLPPAGTYDVYQDEVVHLKASPAAGWQFVTWEGGVVEPAAGNTTILMDGDKTVEAVFYEVIEPQYFTFDVATGTITDYNREDGGPDVLIPAEIGGVSVTSIGNGAFDTKLLDGVIIPDSVTSIGQDAFASNGQLSRLIIGSNVTTIGPGAFQLGNLDNVEFPSGLVSIGDLAFLDNPLVSLVFPDSLTSIGMLSFARISSLESITIGDGVTIGEAAFTESISLFENNFRDAYQGPEGGAGTYTKQEDGTWLKTQ